MSWILTKTGKQFFFDDIENNEIDIEDIAHSLARQCRFNGHTSMFYSVARHSIVMCKQMLLMGKNDLALLALMHDATEAYVGDMVKPLKNLLPEFEVYEQKIWNRISTVFDLPPMHSDIKQLDLAMLSIERDYYLPDHPAEWECLPSKDNWQWPLLDVGELNSHPAHDTRDFLRLFYKLTANNE